MIDLHTHIKYSDGTWNLKELLAEAQKSNIEILSITDHDSVESYYELKESGGTDCHGMKKPDRKIGIGYGNMNISKEIIKNWEI